MAGFNRYKESLEVRVTDEEYARYFRAHALLEAARTARNEEGIVTAREEVTRMQRELMEAYGIPAGTNWYVEMNGVLCQNGQGGKPLRPSDLRRQGEEVGGDG